VNSSERPSLKDAAALGQSRSSQDDLWAAPNGDCHILWREKNGD
jgi:hypothetical protein